MSEVGRRVRRAGLIASLGLGLCGCGERRANYPEPEYRENTLPDWDQPTDETDAPDLGALSGEWVTEPEGEIPGEEVPGGEATEEANSHTSGATAAETSAGEPTAAETSADEPTAAETRAAEPPAAQPENEKKLP